MEMRCVCVLVLYVLVNLSVCDPLVPAKNVLYIIPDILAQPSTEPGPEAVFGASGPGLDPMAVPSMKTLHVPYDGGPEPPDRLVVHAGIPRDLSVYPTPLSYSNHELALNVTWMPSIGAPARDYSIEIQSVTGTKDCRTPMCYEYNIPGDCTWWTVPKVFNPVAETCAIRPGCAYSVKLIAHPWDGHTAANTLVQLDECVSDICSCAHSPHLPVPRVSVSTVSIEGDLFVNISWTLPPPTIPQRLPPLLNMEYYFVSIGKQMVSDAHPSPWYNHAISRKVDTKGPVALGDQVHFIRLPLIDRGPGDERGDPRFRERRRPRPLDVKFLARVSLVDDRGCVGPAGNATAYDPAAENKFPYMTYIIWACFGGMIMLGMIAVIAVSARAVKRFLHALRPASHPAPRPAWFPLQLRSHNEDGQSGQVESSPLYYNKQFQVLEQGDQWEVIRSRVHLSSIIGRGAFGQVHLAYLDMPGGETLTVAAKMLLEDATEEEQQDFRREIAMLKHVGTHKHVIRLIGCCTTRTPLIVLLEHAPRGDLLSLLRAARGRRHGVLEDQPRLDSDVANGRPSEADTEYTNLSDSDPAEEKLNSDGTSRGKDHYVAEPALHLDSATMRDYALQIALGMRHLEERQITHRDLAARNILVDGAGTLKVCDLGLSRGGVYVHTRSRPVPLRWLAPEAVTRAEYSTASDVWAFAVLLWEIATLGGFPYAELSNHEVPSFLVGGGRLPKPARASQSLYNLMMECWVDNPWDRPTFGHLVTKLTIQNQLYVDLDCVFPPSEEEVRARLENMSRLEDFCFNSSEDLQAVTSQNLNHGDFPHNQLLNSEEGLKNGLFPFSNKINNQFQDVPKPPIKKPSLLLQNPRQYSNDEIQPISRPNGELQPNGVSKNGCVQYQDVINREQSEQLRPDDIVSSDFESIDR